MKKQVYTLANVNRTSSWLIDGAHTGWIGLDEGGPMKFVEIHGAFPAFFGEGTITFTEIDETKPLKPVCKPHRHELTDTGSRCILN